MKRVAPLLWLQFSLTFCFFPFVGSPLSAGEEGGASSSFPYTLIDLEAMIDASPQLRLLFAKQQEARNKESIWHDVSVSAGFNPIRTADKFTDRIRAGFAVSMPLDILLFRDTARVSREVEGLEMHKLHSDLRRELRRLWYERERRLVEIKQMEAELSLAQLQVQKVRTLMVAQDASLDAVKETEVAVSRIEATIAGKLIDVRDLEDGLMAVVGKER